MNEFIQPNKPKVTLLSWTRHPLETIYGIWWSSKSTNPILTPEQVVCGERDADDKDGDIRELFRKVVAQKIPVSESISFTFVMENVSVSWREQAVRHRIGHKHDGRIGVDMVPDLADSSFWSQSMRIQNMGAFADNRQYRMADTIVALKDKNPYLLERYIQTMADIQGTYNALVAVGIPMEDARDLIPLGAHHRITWTMNINSMLHIVGERSCWILQLGLWGDVIMGMIRELVEKVDPIFSELATPPCIRHEEFSECQFQHENERRVTGQDALPVCPLYVTNHWNLEWKPTPAARDAVVERAKQYATYWQRDPWTGVKIHD